jgi:opacity protein-like surface antigen
MNQRLPSALFAFAVLAWAAGSARAGSIGVGVFAGTGVPVVQADESNGPVYGVRAPVKLVPLFTAEAFYSSSTLGDVTLDIEPGVTATREGSDVKSYGLNALLTFGGPVTFYPFVGIGHARYTRSGQDDSFTAYQMGLGLGLSPLPKFSIDLRAELQAAVDGSVSRKVGNFTLGASYALFHLP